MPDNPTPEMLKKMRIDTEDDTAEVVNISNEPAKVKGKSRAVTIEDEVDEDMEGSFAPGGDADYFAEEDDEGRFFGGGLTAEQKEILNIFDNAGGDTQQPVSPLIYRECTECRTRNASAGGIVHCWNTEDSFEVRACCKQKPGPEIQVSR